MTHHQLRAARALLVLQQEVLAKLANVGITSLRRFENGNGVGQAIVDALEAAIEQEGAILVASGTTVDGVPSGGGVVLRLDADLPEGTLARIAALNLTSDEAAASLSPTRRSSTGRRARVPVPPGLRKKADDDGQGSPSG